MPSMLDQYVWFLSYTIGYLIVSVLGNLLLISESKGTKFRWSLKPLKPYLKERIAIPLAVLQFAIPFVLSMSIDDYISNIISSTGVFLLPISIITFTMVYYLIRKDMPYKTRLKEKIGISASFAVGIITYVCLMPGFFHEITARFSV